MAKTPSDEYLEILGAVFKEARERAGMSQKKLAEVSGVGRTGIVNLEAAKRNISILIGQMLADGMGVPYASLITEVEKRWSKRKK
ncbi:MAG: helix-turn-helix domain-containing protein [Verrucomicrobiaceae bacterium]|nr:helix-turn-helix domain-containing protein [Verrucomicrobiaceae bacterium]